MFFADWDGILGQTEVVVVVCPSLGTRSSIPLHRLRTSTVVDVLQDLGVRADVVDAVVEEVRGGTRAFAIGTAVRDEFRRNLGLRELEPWPTGWRVFLVA